MNVPDMTAELDKLKAELKKLSSGATVEQIGDLQSEIGDLQSKIGDIQSHAGDQQSKLGEEMGALGEKQGKLGEEQGKLGRQQGELAREATKQMKKLLDDAIAKGLASSNCKRWIRRQSRVAASIFYLVAISIYLSLIARFFIELRCVASVHAFLRMRSFGFFRSHTIPNNDKQRNV